MFVLAWLGVRGHRLWRRAELFRKAFAASPTAVAVIRTADSRFLEVNESYERLLQYSRAELIGRSDEELGIWESTSDRDAALKALGREGRLRDRPIVLRRRDGERLHVVYSAERVEIDGQDARLAMLRDVSEQVRSDELKARVEAQMQQTRRLESIGLLAGGIAHDFNNVLQAVKGYTELAVDGLPADHPVLVPLAQVSEAADRAANFTTKLLTFSRRDAPKTERLSLNRVVSDTGVLLRRAIGGHIQVETIEGTELPGLDGDRGQIEQILMALCINARDAMPGGGTMTIETGRQDFTSDDCRSRPWAKPGRWVFVRVIDTGTGIPADVRPHIFEPFFTTKPVGEGSGLGLSAAYAIVERHGGLIAVDTEPGRGSAFTVYFPSAGADASAPAGRGTATSALAGNGETILLAEDEPFVRDLAVEMLEGASYRVLVARDGGEAEAIVHERAADLHAVVLDVVMPVRNGRQVYDTLRRVRPDIPVIFCSGYSFGELSDVDRFGGTAVLPKPYSRASLLAAVRNAIDSKRQTPT